MKSVTIELGGKPYEIKDLTLGQTQDLAQLLREKPPKLELRVLAVGLSEDHPAMNVAALSKIRPCDWEALDAAAGKILDLAGFQRGKGQEGDPAGAEAPVGEAPAPEATGQH